VVSEKTDEAGRAHLVVRLPHEEMDKLVLEQKKRI
jgi:hypothetical protein